MSLLLFKRMIFNESKNMKPFISDMGFEPVTSLGPDNKQLAKFNFSFFFLIKIPTISTASDKHAFVAYITADDMYMVRSE